jgi:hypothetical protein
MSGEGIEAQNSTTKPLRCTYSRDEMIDRARDFITEMYGPCQASADSDRWHERLGLLVNFINAHFPAS